MLKYITLFKYIAKLNKNLQVIQVLKRVSEVCQFFINYMKE